ncbi:DUF4153 domain-containing protein [Cellulomonas fengjieae]|uniref:DUF4173 domain-containing protein n=1 Tax=Cellulomonas fengjieae TaxID=2819978 RepID=A0ABS3SEA6_9CELL|nr:DUF4173 domain-containing protein [Cellulomonas fengjieae]MBO3084085.1 DUF4173 domain-containing protein [Cellulomonas fengjieae]QVI64660.1 DUF4173 domain-containing protein [Cellulomonas fengjieae]
MTDSAAPTPPSPPALPGPPPTWVAGRSAVPTVPGRVLRVLEPFWAERRRPVTLPTLIASGVVGVLGGVLLVGHQPGLGAALVGLAVWAAAAPALVRRRNADDLVTAALSIVLFAVVAVRDAGWVVVLCALVAMWTGVVAVTSSRSAPAAALAPLTWAAGTARALPWVAKGVGALAGSRRGQLLVVLRTAAITLALLLVFGLLFASADRVFASLMPRFEPDMLPGQVVVGTLVAVVAAALAHLALAPPSWSDARLAPRGPASRGEWLVPVLALDALVLLFVMVQVGALLGGHQHVLATAGLSYSQYAREGFAQLLVVTALTLVVVAVAARRAPRATATDQLVSRLALGALCIGTLGVVASALRRMDLYVDAFGLTRLRLFVTVVEIALAAVFVLLLVAGVRWRGRWLPRAAVQVVAVAMLGLALVNPDAQIVRHNTTAELATDLDVDYLAGLSADAVPAFARISGQPALRSCLLASAYVPPDPGLADWNLGRERATQVLATQDPGTSTACRRDRWTSVRP